MKFSQTVKQGLVVGLAAQMALSVQFATVARAEIVTTETAIARYAETADRAFLLSELQRQDVKDQLIEFGVDPAEVERRLAALSDDEIKSLLSQIDADNAGADFGVYGIINLIVSVGLLLLLTDLLCLTNVYPFAKCARG